MRCTGFSLSWLLLLQSTGSRRTGFSSCGSRALERRLNSCGSWALLLRGMWDLPGPGLEPMYPPLAGGFLTTEPRGKPPYHFYLFIYLWLCWVFVSVRGLSLVTASGGHSSSRCAGLSLSWPLLLRNTGSRCAGSVIVAHGPSCSAACGIFPDQGSNPCPLH